jgi:hypothetical protein
VGLLGAEKGFYLHDAVTFNNCTITVVLNLIDAKSLQRSEDLKQKAGLTLK